jgi:hypothetical protein
MTGDRASARPETLKWVVQDGRRSVPWKLEGRGWSFGWDASSEWRQLG